MSMRRPFLSDVGIYYLSMKPSRLRWTNWSLYRQANAQISAICTRDPRLGYIDVATPLLASGQPPPRDLFRFDGMHLSAKGYALWTGIIRPRLNGKIRGFPPTPFLISGFCFFVQKFLFVP